MARMSYILMVLVCLKCLMLLKFDLSVTTLSITSIELQSSHFTLDCDAVRHQDSSIVKINIYVSTEQNKQKYSLQLI